MKAKSLTVRVLRFVCSECTCAHSTKEAAERCCTCRSCGGPHQIGTSKSLPLELRRVASERDDAYKDCYGCRLRFARAQIVGAQAMYSLWLTQTSEALAKVDVAIAEQKSASRVRGGAA